VIREAMRGKGTVALARVVLAKRERVVMLQPWGESTAETHQRAVAIGVARTSTP